MITEASVEGLREQILEMTKQLGSQSLTLVAEVKALRQELLIVGHCNLLPLPFGDSPLSLHNGLKFCLKWCFLMALITPMFIRSMARAQNGTRARYFSS